MSSRAELVDLDVTASLNTDSAITAINRFQARTGAVEHIFSK
jgi:hypothetical protein